MPRLIWMQSVYARKVRLVDLAPLVVENALKAQEQQAAFFAISSSAAAYSLPRRNSVP